MCLLMFCYGFVVVVFQIRVWMDPNQRVCLRFSCSSGEEIDGVVGFIENL